MTNSLVRLEKHGPVSIVTLDNPPVNAASTKLMNALHARLDEIELDKEARCVILAGAGNKAFCAGGDLREEADFGTPEGARAFQALGRNTLNRLENFSLPIIAAIHGYCIGGGTALGWADAYIGMVPSWGMGLTRLPRYVGRSRALDILLLGHDFDAKTAYDFGLVTKVVAKADLAKEAMIAAERIATASPFAIKATREAIAFNSRESWKDMVDFEVQVCERVFAHPDAHEGPKAFAEKRKPKFGAL